MKVISILLGCFFLSLAAPVPVLAGAWLQSEGSAYIRLSTGILSTNERFDEQGDRVQWDTSGGGFRDSKYQDLESTFYTEIGVRQGWNLVAMTSWKFVEAQQPAATFQTWGFTDITLAAKRALWTWPRTVTSVMGLVTFPTGYDEREYPALGSGVTDISFVGMVGTSGNLFWGTGEVEFQFRGGDFRDRVKGSLGGGWNASRRFGLRAEVRGGVAVGDERPPSADPRFDPAKADPTNLDLAGTVAYRVTGGLAVEAEVRSTVSGKNTLAGTRWSLAIATAPSWSWK